MPDLQTSYRSLEEEILNIICPVGNGTMQHEDCLACSLNIPPACGYSYTLLKGLYDQKEDRSKEVHVTDVTGCLKKAYFDKVDPTPELVSDKLVRFLGVAVHAGMETQDENVACEIPINHMGIVGSTDIVYKDGTLLDLKTTRWMVPDRLPYGSHQLQVNIYAYLLKHLGREINRLFIQYVDMSGPTKCRKCNVTVEMVGEQLLCPKCLAAPRGAHLGAHLVEIPIMGEEEVEQIIEERVTILRGAMEGGAVPPADPSFLCGYCASISRCEEGMAR
jgi:CRISPR/Cas system-associated exonuclease Cas4 (RecB family)